MKIVCILGSPRAKGNTETIAQSFLDVAQKKGAEVKVYQLSKLNYKGCIACMGCKTKHEECAVKDDLNQVLNDARTCDILVMASPIYYGDVTSQMKGFVDRTFCYLVPNFLTSPNPSRVKAGKKCVIILAQNQPDEKMFADVYPKYSSFFKWYGFEPYLIRGVGLFDRSDASKHPELLKQAQELAAKLVK